MGKYRVGEKIKDSHGVDWVVARLWQHKGYVDYALINTETGEHGGLRDYSKPAKPRKKKRVK